MTSAVMQRLQNVRQLGLAHLVYPGANYSRFAHSIGACNNAASLLEAVKRNSGLELTAKEIQEYRLVALLHDIGHYPFSHATEHVVENYYAADFLAEDDVAASLELLVGPEQRPLQHVAPASYRHEPLGEYIIRSNPELKSIFERHGFDPNSIADRFSKAKPDALIGIISSDLDCDRLDYLKRTAHNSGAPYGSVDIRFLIDQATIDGDGVFCFLPKAARAADHLLVSRFFDYMQVPFNKTVVALEWSLVSCLEALLQRELIDCSGKSMEAMVENGDWNHFDDQAVFSHFRTLARQLSQEETVLRDHLSAILDRRPAKLIAGWDELVNNNDRSIAKNEYIAKKLLNEVAHEFSIDPNRLHVWKTPVFFSKADGSIDQEHQSEERVAEAVQILDRKTGKAQLLVARRDTLVSRLSALQMAGLRLYYLPESGKIDPGVVAGIVGRFNDALGEPVL